MLGSPKADLTLRRISHLSMLRVLKGLRPVLRATFPPPDPTAILPLKTFFPNGAQFLQLCAPSWCVRLMTPLFSRLAHYKRQQIAKTPNFLTPVIHTTPSKLASSQSYVNTHRQPRACFQNPAKRRMEEKQKGHLGLLGLLSFTLDDA